MRFVALTIMICVSYVGNCQDMDCIPYKSIVQYLKNDSAFNSYFHDVKEISFHVNSEVGKLSLGNLLFMHNEYIEEKYGVSYPDDSAVYSKIYKALAENEVNADLVEKIVCLTEFEIKMNSNIRLGFAKNEINAIMVFSERIYSKPQFSYGMAHLFFFDEESKIRKVHFTHWGE